MNAIPFYIIQTTSWIKVSSPLGQCYGTKKTCVSQSLSQSLINLVFTFMRDFKRITFFPPLSLNLLRKLKQIRAVVVAQLVERLLPISEVCGSNPVIGKKLFIYWTFVFCQLCIEKTKIKKKEAGNGPFKKNQSITVVQFTGLWVLAHSPTGKASCCKNWKHSKLDQTASSRVSRKFNYL